MTTRLALPPLATTLLGLLVLLATTPKLTAATTNVNMSGTSFSPAVVNVRVGDTVTWVLVSGTHTATGTGADPICGNGIIAASQSVTFNSAGSFPYRCLFHSSTLPLAGMTGLVVVAAASIPPSVSITAPTNGAKFFAGSPFLVTFSASDADGSVTKVDLYDGPDLIFSLPPPFTTNTASESAGTSTVVAVATDNDGLTSTSAPITLQFLSTNVLLFSAPITSGSATFTASNTIAGHTYTFDALTNFTGPLAARWFPLQTNLAPSNHFRFTDSVLTNAVPRLYRVRQSL
jgi:plastocyanin